MDMLKNTACVLGLALLGASLGACNKNEGQGAAPASSAPAPSAPSTTMGGGSSSSSGGASSSSGAGME